MREDMPRLGPNGESEYDEVEQMESVVPNQLVPEASDSNPEEGDFIPEASESLGEAAPSLPIEDQGQTGITAWHNNKRFTALWCMTQNRNAWAGVSGMGWKRLSNKSDAGIVALNMLAAHAREKNARINFREDKGMIREIYVW